MLHIDPYSAHICQICNILWKLLKLYAIYIDNYAIQMDDIACRINIIPADALAL